MADSDTAYFYRRAQVELDQAQQATHPVVVSAHYQLDEAYLAKLATEPAQATAS